MRFVGIMAMAALMAAAGTTHGGTKETAARAAYEEGTTAFNLGHFEDAASHYEAAYKLVHDPNMLFNIAQSYRLAGNLEQALPVFRGFLREAPANAPNRSIAERFIEELKRRIEENRAAKAPTETQATAAPAPVSAMEPPQAVPPPIATDSAVPKQFQQESPVEPPPLPAETVSVREPTPTGQAGSGLRVAGLVTAASGGAALVAGIVFNVKANAMSSDLEKPYNYSASSDSTRKNYKVLGWVSYSVGAACVATGAALYYLGWRSGQDSSLALAPTVSPDLKGLSLAGAF